MLLKNGTHVEDDVEEDGVEEDGVEEDGVEDGVELGTGYLIGR